MTGAEKIKKGQQKKRQHYDRHVVDTGPNKTAKKEEPQPATDEKKVKTTSKTLL